TYEQAVVDATRKGDSVVVTTKNVRRLVLVNLPGVAPPSRVIIDGQEIKPAPEVLKGAIVPLEKSAGKWAIPPAQEVADRLKVKPEKSAGFQGPIDDAFGMGSGFTVVKPSGPGWHPAAEKHAAASADQFGFLWDKYFRGQLPVTTAEKYDPKSYASLVLFGDPASNPLIAKVLPKLPITWTKDELVVNGVKYDPKTHVPVLIYPNPLNENRSYVVINSGHTFKEADLKGTNALLYPRLGDWAVIKPTPTANDPAAYEVVAAGLFDENWQFPKK